MGALGASAADLAVAWRRLRDGTAAAVGSSQGRVSGAIHQALQAQWSTGLTPATGVASYAALRQALLLPQAA